MTLPPTTIALFAVVSGAALASVALSLLTVWRMKSRPRAACHGEPGSPADTAIAVLQLKIDELQQQIEELRRQGPVAAGPSVPRACLNLERRTQALRMNRRGEAPAQIAAALEIPLQEVDLLLKVHRIVLRSI
jgi:hypothetical protein